MPLCGGASSDDTKFSMLDVKAAGIRLRIPQLPTSNSSKLIHCSSTELGRLEFSIHPPRGQILAAPLPPQLPTMASLNLSTNGPSIKNSYQKIVESPAPSGPAVSSPTYGQWAVYAVQAPLVSAFQQDTGKESVLKVQSTGGETVLPTFEDDPKLITSAEGELIDLVEEFSDGRIQFAFVKVKDPNTTLPKCVFIAWVSLLFYSVGIQYTDNTFSAVKAYLSGQRVTSAVISVLCKSCSMYLKPCVIPPLDRLD